MTHSDVPKTPAGAVLTIDLAALAENYAILQGQLSDAECAAVVKANGYGLGAEKVGQTLYEAGCRTFFVAQLEEGIRLRKALPAPEIHILGGLVGGAEAAYIEHNLIPVLGSLQEIAAWRHSTERSGMRPCDIHVDTGMMRLGLPADELMRVAEDASLLRGLDIKNVMSHLASADDADSPQTAQQLSAFRELRRIIPQGQACLANSSGIFRGPEYHFDRVRPGVALYGVNPTPEAPNPMRPVVQLHARIVQIRNAEPGQTVGYGAAHTIRKPSRIATLSVGYADGYLRSLSGRAFAYIGDQKIPLVGRVSMDLITLDVTAVSTENCRVGTWVELLGDHHSVDDLALEGGTIGYEVLTSLGSRYHRIYKHGTKA